MLGLLTYSTFKLQKWDRQDAYPTRLLLTMTVKLDVEKLSCLRQIE